MFRNDFVTQVNAMGMLNVSHDSEDINVHQAIEQHMVAYGLNSTEMVMFKTVWAMFVNSISDKATKQLVYSCQGPAKA